MAENNRNIGGQQNESRQDQPQTDRLSNQAGQETGRGSYGSNREQDLHQNTSVGNQQTDRSNSQSSSLESDDMGTERNQREESTDRNSRQDDYNSRSGSL